MSLLEQFAQAKGQIHALQALKERATRASEFEQRAAMLSRIADDLGTLRAPAAVLREAGIEVPQLEAALSGALLARASRMAAGYASDRSSILKPFPDESLSVVFINPCTAFRQRMETALMQAWTGWVRARMPAIDPDVLHVLHGVAALRETVSSIQALLAATSLKANALPQSLHEVAEVRVLSERANQAWYALAGDGIAPEVLGFLRAAGSPSGEAYDRLTPSILAWLDAHHLRRVLRIRLG